MKPSKGKCAWCCHPKRPTKTQYTIEGKKDYYHPPCARQVIQVRGLKVAAK